MYINNWLTYLAIFKWQQSFRQSKVRNYNMNILLRGYLSVINLSKYELNLIDL